MDCYVVVFLLIDDDNHGAITNKESAQMLADRYVWITMSIQLPYRRRDCIAESTKQGIFGIFLYNGTEYLFPSARYLKQ